MGGVQHSEADKQRAAFEHLLRGPDGNILPAPKRLLRPPVIEYQRDAVGRIVIEDGRDRLKSWDVTTYHFDEKRPLSRIFWKRKFEEFGDNDQFVPFFMDEVLNKFAISEYSEPSFAHLSSKQQMNLLFRALKDVEPDKVDFACRTAYVYMAQMLAENLLIERFPGVDFVSGKINDKPNETYKYPLCYLTESSGGPGIVYPIMATGMLPDKTKGVMSMHGWVKGVLEQALKKILPSEEITEGRLWYFGGTEWSKKKWHEHLTELYFMVVGAAFCVAAYDSKMNHLVENAYTYLDKHGNDWTGRYPILRIADADKVPAWALTQRFDKKKAFKLEEFVGPWVAEFYGRAFVSGSEKIFYNKHCKHWSCNVVETHAIKRKKEWIKEEKQKMKERREAEKEEEEKRKYESGAGAVKAEKKEQEKRKYESGANACMHPPTHVGAGNAKKHKGGN